MRSHANTFFAPVMQVYISTVESKKYPVLGLQWHPEKNSFEWTRHKQIPHGYWSTEVTHQVHLARPTGHCLG
jgi:hypothetical protein